jgi:predicted CXXCH cytochrome family protein
MAGVAHDMQPYAYNASNHGHATANLESRASQDSTLLASSALPYADKADIECSSCHNPHENTVRPYMRVASGDVQTLCIKCHARDNDGGTAGANAYGDNNVGDSRNGGAHTSMHPVDVPYANRAGRADISLKTLDTIFTQVRGAASQGAVAGTDELGGKLLDPLGGTGNMGCPTCHQVHGDGTTTNRYPWLLVAGNQISTGTPANSAVCELCHDGGDGGGAVIAGTTNEHPYDTASGSTRFTWTAWDSSNAYESQDVTWPGINGLREAGCTSCHSAHYGLPNTPMQRSYAVTGGTPYDTTPTGAVQNTEAGWCSSCHSMDTAQPFGHHSNIQNDSGFTSVIDCADCHRSGTPASSFSANLSAHRDFAGLELVSSGPVFGLRKNFCLKCHAGTAFTAVSTTIYTFGDNTLQAGVWNPTNDMTNLPSEHGTKRTVSGVASSHYLGVTTTLQTPTGTTTPRTEAWESNFYSVYGQTDGTLRGDPQTGSYGTFASSDEIICESCHNIRWNVGSEGNGAGITASGSSGWENNLLLEQFEDDDSGIAQAGSAEGSLLCVGCHAGGTVTMATLDLDTHKPTGTHPVTNSLISKVVDSGMGADNAARAINDLLTTAPQSYATVVGAPGILSYPAAEAMDCDSCHRAHDGDPDSASATNNYILEEAATGDVQSMCTTCHAY